MNPMNLEITLRHVKNVQNDLQRIFAQGEPRDLQQIDRGLAALDRARSLLGDAVTILRAASAAAPSTRMTSNESDHPWTDLQRAKAALDSVVAAWTVLADRRRQVVAAQAMAEAQRHTVH